MSTAADDADEEETPEARPGTRPQGRRRLPLVPRRPLLHDDGITARLAHQWAQRREQAAHPEPIRVVGGPSNFSRAQVPWGFDLAAAWSWRLLVISAASYLLLRLFAHFSVITIPVAIALLITALASPLVNLMSGSGVPRGIAAFVAVLGGLALVTALLTFAGQQVANGAQELVDQTAQGLGKIRDWLQDGPLHASDSQINNVIDQAQAALHEQSQGGRIASRLSEVGSALTHLLAGFFIVLFSTYFFLAEGERIWAWFVRLTPRAAREHVDSSGRVAWISLTQFVRATVIVALVDALGIMLVAAILKVPFILAIGVLVFLGAFIPLVGATVAGAVAVLVALVDQGPYTALFMLLGVIAVQQLEGHVLQPFLMGRWVSLHPLGVIIAIAAGALVGGVAGALVAVPLAAALNAVVQHLAANTSPGEDPVEELAEDYDETGRRPEQLPADGAVGDQPESPAQQAGRPKPDAEQKTEDEERG